MSTLQTDSTASRRIAVTLAAVALVLAGERISLCHVEGIRLALTQFGVWPYTTSAMIVWICCQALPKLREQDVTRWPITLGLTVALAVYNARLWGLTVATSFSIPTPTWPIVGLVGGGLLCVALAEVVRRYGCGNGISVVMAALSASYLAEHGYGALTREIDLNPDAPLHVASVVVLTLALLALVALVIRRAVATPDRDSLRLPLCGVIPLALLQFAMPSLPRWMIEIDWVMGLAVVVLAGVFSCLFYQLSFFGLGVLFPGALPSARAVLSAITKSIALNLLLFLVAKQTDYGPLFSLALIVAVVLDVQAEWNARTRDGALVVVSAQHRVANADEDADRLRAEGISVLARGARHRTLWHVLAPQIVIELLVSASMEAKARAVLAPPSRSS